MSVLKKIDSVLFNQAQRVLARPLTSYQKLVIKNFDHNYAQGLELFLLNMKLDSPITHADFLAKWRVEQSQYLIDAGFSAAEVDKLFAKGIIGDREKSAVPESFATLENLQRDLNALTAPDETNAKVHNTLVLKNLAAEPVHAVKGRVEALNPENIDEIYQAISENRVVSSSVTNAKYDNQGKNIGFCFGRAMAVHLEALARGVSKQSIRKIWALGNLMTGATRWRYHVATAIRGTDNRWYVVDPFMGRSLEIGEWYKRMAEINPDKKMQVFVTEPQRMSPGSAAKYNRQALIDPLYNGYFTDFLQAFKAEAPFSGTRILPKTDGEPAGPGQPPVH